MVTDCARKFFLWSQGNAKGTKEVNIEITENYYFSPTLLVF